MREREREKGMVGNNERTNEKKGESKKRKSEKPPPPRLLHLLLRRRTSPAKPMQLLNLSQHQLQQLLAMNQIQMPAHLGVLPRKPVQPPRSHVLVELGLHLAREAHVKVVEHLNVEEEHGRLGELGGDRVEEDLRAVVLVFEGLALAGLGGEDPHVEDVGAGAEEDGFSAWAEEEG